jgi:hypothetical protein
MHVKVCVDCGEEYRPEIAVCADCGGRLEVRSGDGEGAVPETPSAPGGPHPDADFTDSILHAERATDLRDQADQLVEAGIDFILRPATPAGYRLLVTADDRERALAALGLLADDAGATDGGDSARRCPACGTAVPAEVADCPECGLAVGDEAESED